MIQQSVNVQQAPPPRLHPKKRKFDLSELEDDHHQQQQQSVAAAATISSPVIISSNPPSSSTLAPSTTVVYHQQKITSDMIPAHQNGNQQNILTSSTYNPHITQIVKNTSEVQQIIKRQSFTSYR